MGSLRVAVHEGERAEDLAARSREALDRPLAADGELEVATLTDDAVLLGAFQRAGELPATSLPLLRRGSGGGEIRVSPGAVWVQLALSRVDAFVACPPDRILNRYVRPLLKALNRGGLKAGYFDRDWVGASGSAVASVAFAHDAGSGRALFEAVVAGPSQSIALRSRPAFRGRLPVPVKMEGLAEMIGREYAAAYPEGVTFEIAEHVHVHGSRLTSDDLRSTTHGDGWGATREEAIGVTGAARDANDRVRVGGEMMASRDAIDALEDAANSAEDLDAAIDAIFSRPGVALFGVKSLRSLRDVIVDVRRKT